MGEYLNYKGESLKIGTCESLYYTSLPRYLKAFPDLTAIGDQTPQSYLNPAHGYRFRFPFPDEDQLNIGEELTGHNFNRGHLFTVLDTPENRENVGFSKHSTKRLVMEAQSSPDSYADKYSVLIPCPLDLDAWKDSPVKITSQHFKPGFLYIELVSQKVMPVEGHPKQFCLWPVVRCPGCGDMARVTPQEWPLIAFAIYEYHRSINTPPDEFTESILSRALAGYMPQGMPGAPRPTMKVVKPEPVQQPTAPTITADEVSNDFCYFSIDDHGISGRDKTDSYNDPSCYSRNKRGLKNGWKALQEQFNSTTTMYQGMQILEPFKLSMHSYCAVD